MTRYRYRSEWTVTAPVERVWDLLLDVGRWPEWWRGFKFVERISDGDDAGVGMVVRQGWRSRLPYTMTLVLTVEGVVRHSMLTGRTTGDMDGHCTWTFTPAAEGTRVGFLMDVMPGHWWMNLPVPLARRVFEANFQAVMAWGGEGMARELGVHVDQRSMEAATASV